MTESQMTEAATTTEGSPESNDVADALYNNSQPAETKQQSTDEQNQVTDQKGDDAEKTESEQAPEGAPEKYEFKAPEGQTYDPEIIETYSEIAKEFNLSQEKAQKMLDVVAPKLAERQAAQIQSIHEQWVESARSDKEFGGEKLPENLGVAKKALDTWGNPALRTLLNESGIGNHPEVIRFMVKAGKSLSEEKFVGSSPGAGTKTAPRNFNEQASALYSNQS